MDSCVADASNDIQNETILELARDIDSSRKVGVFTKCDKSDNPEDVSDPFNTKVNTTYKMFRLSIWSMNKVNSKENHFAGMLFKTQEPVKLASIAKKRRLLHSSNRHGTKFQKSSEVFQVSNNTLQPYSAEELEKHFPEC